MEIIFNKANNLYLELPHKIYNTITSTRTKKTIWIFWGYTRSSLMIKVQISLIFILQSSVVQVVPQRVVLSVKHRVWYKQKIARQTSLYLITITKFITFCYINLLYYFSKLPATPQRQTVNNYECINYCHLYM